MMGGGEVGGEVGGDEGGEVGGEEGIEVGGDERGTPVEEIWSYVVVLVV